MKTYGSSAKVELVMLSAILKIYLFGNSLQNRVIEKDSCLDALNLQLGALIRRESLKEPFSSATTTSTEYRTLNDDFNRKSSTLKMNLMTARLLSSNFKHSSLIRCSKSV